ncbi:MAG: Hpt domain-containing protein, partial [Woeseiaceae bacterium]|nr:Hpt domain-containing protein [Woeseiaceae bacterium]
MTGDTGIEEQPLATEVDNPIRALSIVATELMDTIQSAHRALEDCVDGRGGTTALVRTGTLLHQARGALLLTETYGAALLVEEMENACEYLSTLREGKGREDGLDALTRSMVQLPLYIERLLGGGRDIALVLLPLLNDLRAARGEPLLSEGTLLLLNLSPSRSEDKRQFHEGSGEDPVLVARRLRPKFQLALLGWINGGAESGRHLETLSRVAASLEHASVRDDMFQLWRVVGAVLEALREGGLETSVALKRLLGQADRQIKHTIDEGVGAFDKHPVDDLMNNLLYYVARSGTAGERISDIRKAFNLSELLPGDDQVEHAREELAAPSVALMKTVASAIKEDLGAVKDVLDIFVRTGMNNPTELVPQFELLKKISDTLGVLGLGELRNDVDSEIERMKGVVERGGTRDEQVILDIASTLLRVEDRLDRELVRLTVPREAAEAADDSMPEAEAADFRQVAESVMRECIINLARIKETVSQSMTSSAPSQGLDAIPSLIRGIKAGLLMLNKTRAMEIVERIGNFITLMLQSGGTSQLTQKETDRLADAIVSIEYYMETVKAGRREPEYMLDNADTCLGVLRGVEERLREEQSAPASIDQTAKIATADMARAAQEAAAASAGHKATAVMPMPVVATDAEHLDPELLELFIEEAREEVASIRRNLPQWIGSPDDMETLITVRRSFHTLKGSGRMVGAERIGEYCWSVENLLNRLINRTLKRTPPMVEFIAAAAAAVPELIEELEVGSKPEADIALFIARAHAFAEGDPNAEVLTIERDEEAGSEPVLEMDPVLLDIFRKETAGHLKVITDYIAACAEQRPPYAVTDQLYRACHTLHGSANMANVDRGVQVAGALNRFVRRVHENGPGFDNGGIQALEASAKAIARIVSDINRQDADRADFSKLTEHINRLAERVVPRGTVAEETADEAPAEAEAAPETAPAPEPAPPAEPEYDAEIAAIFTEESAELLESVDKAFGQWSEDRSQRAALEELKRHLHTLKGGARMAGIASMGNLSHEVETLLGAVEDGRVVASASVDEVLQRSIDELHRMRDRVIAGKAVPADTALEKRLQSVTSGFEFASDADVEAPAPPSAPAETGLAEETAPTEFSIEPEDTVSMVIVDSPLADELGEIPKVPPQEPPGEKPLGDEPPVEAVPEVVGTPAPVEDVTEPPAPPPEPPRVPEPPPTPQVIARPERRTIAVGPDLERGEERRAAELRGIKRGDARPEYARIDADLLEDLLNAAGEISIYHS